MYSRKRCQFYRTVATCCQNIATNLPISSNCNMSVKIRLVATCQACYKLLKQLAASLWLTSFDNQLATSLLTTCNSLFCRARVWKKTNFYHLIKLTYFFGVATLTRIAFPPQPRAPCISTIERFCSFSVEKRTKP